MLANVHNANVTALTLSITFWSDRSGLNEKSCNAGGGINPNDDLFKTIRNIKLAFHNAYPTL
jgi:hypothetical protein